MVRRTVWGCIFGLTMISCATSNRGWNSCRVCPMVDLVDFSGGPPDHRDKPAFERALQQCKARYVNSACLITFTRRAPGQYEALCGLPKERLCE